MIKKFLDFGINSMYKPNLAQHQRIEIMFELKNAIQKIQGKGDISISLLLEESIGKINEIMNWYNIEK